MPILPILLLSAPCLPLPRPAPPLGPGPAARARPTPLAVRPRPAPLLPQFRRRPLFPLLPVGLIATQLTLNRFAPDTARADWFKLLSFAVFPALVVLLPVVVKPLLGLRPLPPGPVRDRVAATA